MMKNNITVSIDSDAVKQEVSNMVENKYIGKFETEKVLSKIKNDVADIVKKHISITIGDE